RNLRNTLVVVSVLSFGAGLGCGSGITQPSRASAGRGDNDLTWHPTCGDPVCFFPDHGPPEGVRVCDPDAGEAQGQPCDTLDDTCYTGCGARLVCTDHDLIDPRFGCPISSRRFKQDINYLSAADQERVAQELRNIRLATYQYKRGIDDGRTHLGFIIEDDPD